jgi:hypothetical protein
LKNIWIKGITIIIFLCIFIWILNSVTIITKTDCNYKVGIIDTSLSEKYNNIIYSQNIKYNNKEKTHGDELIAFIYQCQDKVDLFYFDASDDEGNIETKSIIKGLEWMVDNSVEKVNISLSTKTKDKDLESWIKNHKEIIVYASYNNKINSYDYPAMYSKVYASGSDSRINYKNIDFKYRNNYIIILPNIFNVYHGNSYLSLLSMLKN